MAAAHRGRKVLTLGGTQCHGETCPARPSSVFAAWDGARVLCGRVPHTWTVRRDAFLGKHRRRRYLSVVSPYRSGRATVATKVWDLPRCDGGDTELTTVACERELESITGSGVTASG